MGRRGQGELGKVDIRGRPSIVLRDAGVRYTNPTAKRGVINNAPSLTLRVG